MLKKLFILTTFFTYATLASANQCKTNDLFIAKKIQHSGEELEAIADETSLVGKDVYKLQGNAEVYAQGYFIGADEMQITKSSKTIDAKNNVKVQTGGLLATANALTVTQQDDGLSVESGSIAYQYSPTGGNGKAGSFSAKNNVETLTNASYSLCVADEKDWQIKAEQIILDENKNQGIAINATVEFFGIPLGYIPKYSWILEGRGSGFLAPSLSSYSIKDENGTQIDIPYYFNIAPDKDLTLTLTNLSSRGQLLGGLYRQLINEKQEDGYFQAEAEVLADDKKTDERRWLLDAEYQKKLSTHTRLDVNVNRASDEAYLYEIKHDNTQEALQSDIKLTFENDNTTAYILSEHEQVINNGTHTYTRDVEVFAKKSITTKDITIDASIVGTHFEHLDNSKITGNRTHIDFKGYKIFKTHAYEITPHVGINTTHYDLERVESKNRTMYSAGVDSKFFFERNTTMFNTDIVHTLTPRISYFYTPTKNQDDLPNFDSEQTNISYNGLFQENSWTGIDRIDGANNITLGFDSDIINNDNGDTYASFALARSYNVDTKEKSNLIASADFSYNEFRMNNTWQYNDGLVAKDTTFSYKKDGISFVTLGHHLTSDNHKSASISAALPISGTSHIFASVNRSIDEDITNYQTVGFMFDSCCSALRIAHFKTHNDGEYDDEIKIEFIFKGLGSNNRNLHTRIQQDIPNYLPEL